jgi:hypothetical protein
LEAYLEVDKSGDRILSTWPPPWLHQSGSGSEREVGVMAEEWILAATVFLSGLASGLLGMLSAIMRPMLAAMDGRDFRNFMEAFLRYAGHS